MDVCRREKRALKLNLSLKIAKIKLAFSVVVTNRIKWIKICFEIDFQLYFFEIIIIIFIYWPTDINPITGPATDKI